MKLTDLKLLCDVAYFQSTTGLIGFLPPKGFAAAADRLVRNELLMRDNGVGLVATTDSGHRMLDKILSD